MIARLQRDWLLARKRNPSIPPLTLTNDAVVGMAERLRTHGAAEVLRVARGALLDAEKGRIAGAFWARMFIGAGYEARAEAMGRKLAELEAKRMRYAKACRPLTDFELRLVEKEMKGGAPCLAAQA